MPLDIREITTWVDGDLFFGAQGMVLAYSNVCGHNSEFMDRLQVTSCSCVNTYSLMPMNASAFHS